MSTIYKILDLKYDFRAFVLQDQVWASVGEPHIVWLNEQDESQFIIQEQLCYDFDNLGLPLKSEVFITFNNVKLETEFLLRFGDRVTTKHRVS